MQDAEEDDMKPDSREYWHEVAMKLGPQLHQANKTASDAKFEIDRLVAEVHIWRAYVAELEGALTKIRDHCQQYRLPCGQIYEIADEVLTRLSESATPIKGE